MLECGVVSPAEQTILVEIQTAREDTTIGMKNSKDCLRAKNLYDIYKMCIIHFFLEPIQSYVCFSWMVQHEIILNRGFEFGKMYVGRMMLYPYVK